MASPHSVSRNFAAALLTQLLSWCLTFSVTLFLPRYAGVAGLGGLGVAGAFVSIFGVLSALGTSSVLVKEIARDRSRARDFLSAALLLRVPLALVMGAAAYCLALALHYSPDLQVFILVAAVGMVFGTVNDALGATLQGMENLTRQGIGVLTDKFLLSGLTILLIYLKQPLWTIAATGLVTALVSCAVNLFSLRSILPLQLTRPDFVLMRYLVTTGFAFVGLSVFMTLYGRSDPIILKFFTSEVTVGWYELSARLVGTSLFIPTAVNAALLPTLGRLYLNDSLSFVLLAKRVIRILAVIGVAIATILLVGSHRIIEVLPYPPEYAGSIPVLRVGGLTVLFYYLTVGVGSVVVASDRQARMVGVFGLSCLIGIPGCIAGTYITHRLFQNGAIGAMISDTFIEMLILFGLLRISSGLLVTRDVISLLLRLTVAAVPMGLLMLWLTSPAFQGLWLGGLWSAAPGMLLYIGGCFLLRCISVDEVREVVRKIPLRGRTRGAAIPVSETLS